MTSKRFRALAAWSISRLLRGCSESDWKVFRRLREVALNRFCDQVLDDINDIGRHMNAMWPFRSIEISG